MHHRSGDLSSLHWCSKGCISNQLLLTNLFDEFDFVQISFGILARATCPFDGILFYKSILVAFVKMTAKPSEAHDGSQSEKCFVKMKICFLYARTKGVVFYHACLLHCGECELSFCMRCAWRVKVGFAVYSFSQERNREAVPTMSMRFFESIRSGIFESTQPSL